MSEGAQSQMLKSPLENSYDLEMSSKEDAMSEMKTRIRTSCKMLQSRLTLDATVRSWSAIGAKVHNASILCFFELLAHEKIGPLLSTQVLSSGIPTYGRLQTNKAVLPSTALGCAGRCAPR